MKLVITRFLFLLLCSGFLKADGQTTTVGLGWAGNSVNAVIFRKNSISSWKGNQYIAYYDQDKNVVLGKRKLGASKWVTKITPYKGNTADHTDQFDY